MNDYFRPDPNRVPNQEPPVGAKPVSPEEKEALQAMLRRIGNRNGLLLLGMFGISNLLALGVSLAVEGLGQGLDPSTRQSVLTLAAFAVQYLIAVPILLLINTRGRERGRIPLRRPALSAGTIAKWSVIAFGCTYAVNLVCNTFFSMLESAGLRLHAPSMVLQPTLFDNLITLVFFGLIAPVCEELFFRGALLANLRRGGDWFAVVVVAVLFGLMHMNYQQMFYAAAMGMFAGFLCMRAESVYPAVFVHFSLNIIGSFQSILLSRVGTADLDRALQSGDTGWALTHLGPLLGIVLLSALCLALTVAGVVLFCVELTRWRTSSFLHLPNACPQLSAGEKAAAYFSAPGTIAFVVIALGMTLLSASGLA